MKITKKILIAGLSVFALGAFVSCDGEADDGPATRPSWLYEDAEWPFTAVNEVEEEISGNLLENGNADGGAVTDSDISVSLGSESGCAFTAVDGGVTGKCWRVTQTGGKTVDEETGAVTFDPDEEWQEFNIDLTDLYGQGKSFLLTFKLKADPQAQAEHLLSDGEGLEVSYSLYNGAVKNWAEKKGVQHYEYDDSDSSIVGPWSGPFSSDTDTFEDAIGEGKILTTGSAAAGEGWKQYYYVIAAEDIEKKVDNTGVYAFGIAMSMGKNAIGGYSYLIDDIEIHDLNPSIERLGRTAFREPEPEEPEEPEDSGDSAN